MKTKIRLTKKQENDLSSIKRNSHLEIIRDRAHAVLLRNKGKTLENIAEALLRSLDFVVQSMQKFKDGELENLALTGHNRKLSAPRRKNIIDLIKNKAPNELKGFNFNGQFWTTDILRTVIKRKHGAEYKTEKSYYDLFKAAGFSFHKPKTKDFRQDPAKMKEFKGALKKAPKQQKFSYLGRGRNESEPGNKNQKCLVPTG